MSDRNDNVNTSPLAEGGGEVTESKSIQERVEDFFNKAFGKWGLLLAVHPGKIFALSILFFVLLSSGFAMRKGYEDEQLVWTPADNGSLLSRNKGMKLFPSKGGFISVIAEVKDPSKDDASIITLAALNEIKAFADEMAAASADINGAKVAWTDICTKVGADCLRRESVLQFAYETVPQNAGPPKKKWKPEAYADDAALLAAVRAGTKGGQIIDLGGSLGGTVPEEITQDKETGANDIKSAKAAMLGYPYKYGDYKIEEINLIEKEMEAAAAAFNENSKAVNVYMFT